MPLTTEKARTHWMITFLVLLPTAVAGCPESSTPQVADIAPKAQSPLFLERASQTGLIFNHNNGATGDYQVPEIMGSGVGLIDVDSDGDLDVVFVQGGELNLKQDRNEASSHRLFRNEFYPTGELRFTDISADSNLTMNSFGMGVASGDVDNDGDVDLYITAFGENAMFRNVGNGRFENITRMSGTAMHLWSSSASFCDYDADGDLDLYIANYMQYSLTNRKECTRPTGERDYCGPASFEPVTDRLFRNEGNGSFSDVTATTGIDVVKAAGLGVVCQDFNDDGWPDFYVANDGYENHLWINEGGSKFSEEALIAGLAYNQAGRSEAGMGLTAGDVDGDGDDDLFVTHLLDETNTLYRNNGAVSFQDATLGAGLGASSQGYTGFGTRFFDFDLDGHLDIFIANGAVRANTEASGDHHDVFGQGNQLLHNLGRGQFSEITKGAGAALTPVQVSRGAAFGDIDDDGDQDIVVTNNGGPAQLLINQHNPESDGWLGIRLVNFDGRDAIGARAGLQVDERDIYWRTVRTDGSYLSAHDPRLSFGIPDMQRDYQLIVIWPNGTREQWPMEVFGSYLTVRQR